MDEDKDTIIKTQHNNDIIKNIFSHSSKNTGLNCFLGRCISLSAFHSKIEWTNIYHYSSK